MALRACLQDDPFAEIDIPESLHDSLRRHRENLANLVASLRSVGLGEAQIEASVSLMVDSYKAELLSAMKALVR